MGVGIKAILKTSPSASTSSPGLTSIHRKSHQPLRHLQQCSAPPAPQNPHLPETTHTVHQGQSQPPPTNPPNRSNHLWSTSSNPPTTAQSTSIIATVRPPTTMGTTISLRDRASHAMCPGKSRTSCTSCVVWVWAAVPHTPRPKRMVWHATRPWKGARMSCGVWEGLEGGVGSRV